jgi:hypothetical protein
MLPVMQFEHIFFVTVIKCIYSIGHVVWRLALMLKWGNPRAGQINSLFILICYGFLTLYSQQIITWMHSCPAMKPILSTALLNYKLFQTSALLIV